MQNSKKKTKWVTFGIAVVALASSLAPSKAQAQENFAWITNTNGVTWKMEFATRDLSFWDFDETSESPKIAEIAEIVVPEHAIIKSIFIVGCVNLTNIVLHPVRPAEGFGLYIYTRGSGLRNITCKQTMRDYIWLLDDAFFHEGEWAIGRQRSVQWTQLSNIEIRTLSTNNGPELEIIWRDGNLQIADAVNGKWKDYSGNSPLRFPLAVNSKAQQFFRIRRSR